MFTKGEKNIIRSETIVAINQIMSELKEKPTTIGKTLEVLVSGDTMLINQTNIIVNIDEDSFNQSEPLSKYVEEENWRRQAEINWRRKEVERR